jgi:cell division protein FtsL
MNRKLRLLLIITLPVFVFANVYQTYSYQQLDQTVAAFEDQQKAWLEHNKRIIAGIAVLSSPERINEIAKDKLGLVQKPMEPRLRIRVPARSGTNNG